MSGRVHITSLIHDCVESRLKAYKQLFVNNKTEKRKIKGLMTKHFLFMACNFAPRNVIQLIQIFKDVLKCPTFNQCCKDLTRRCGQISGLKNLVVLISYLGNVSL
jgi:hypothetical protein